MDKKQFGTRLAKLRQSTKASAREMSLTLELSDNYMNQIENGKTYPSMEKFFYICDYLKITPQEFFDTESTNPTKVNELLEIVKSLPNEQLDTLIALAKGLKK